VAENFLSDMVTNGDRDDDGLSDVEADEIGSDRNVADTDGYSDFEKVAAGSDLLNPG
jgi:hypothetical protein